MEKPLDPRRSREAYCPGLKGKKPNGRMGGHGHLSYDPAMTARERLTEVVEAEGHLIDSQLLNVIFDTVIKWNAAFEVLEFRIGRTNEEPSFISMLPI